MKGPNGKPFDSYLKVNANYDNILYHIHIQNTFVQIQKSFGYGNYWNGKDSI